MDQDLLARLAEALRREKAELEAQIQSYTRSGSASLKESTQELSSYDNHPGDLGSETYERSKDLALRDNVRSLHHQVQAALTRIAAGTYGSCARCGRAIEDARLLAIPHADLCLVCQRAEEAYDPPRWRPIEEEVLTANYRKRRTPVTDDGEDSWQDMSSHRPPPSDAKPRRNNDDQRE